MSSVTDKGRSSSVEEKEEGGEVEEGGRSLSPSIPTSLSLSLTLSLPLSPVLSAGRRTQSLSKVLKPSALLLQSLR